MEKLSIQRNWILINLNLTKNRHKNYVMNKATFILVRLFSYVGVAIFFVASTPANAQLNVSTTLTPLQLVQNVLVGGGVSVSNVTYSGAAGSFGEFTTGTNPTNQPAAPE